MTAGAGSLACAAASGAAANAVSYAISAAQKGSFSWSALGKTTALGAAEGLAGGALGEAASAAGGAIMSTLARDGADEATTMASEDGGQGAEDAGSCVVGGQSFTASTKVLTATGALVAISKLTKGEKVLAASTRTGKNQAEPVAAVLVHHDTNLYDLKVRSGSVTSVIATTSNHLFWVPGTHRWVKAAALHHGTHLRTPARTNAVVTGGYIPRHHDGWMWDLTIPSDHDFYVLPAEDGADGQYYHVDEHGVSAVLVHNINGECGSEVGIDSGGLASEAFDHRMSQVGFQLRNVALAKVVGRDELVYGISRSENGIHSEDDILNQLNPAEKIEALYSEREPCLSCEGKLAASLTDDADVTWSVPWGDDSTELGQAINSQSNERLREMLLAAARRR